MSRKNRYPCDILDHVFAYNFWIVNATVMKFGTIIENGKWHIIMYLLIIFMFLFFNYTLMQEKDAILFFGITPIHFFGLADNIFRLCCNL